MSRYCDCQFLQHQDVLKANAVPHGMTCCDSTLISDSVSCQHFLKCASSGQSMESELPRDTKVFQGIVTLNS